MDEDTRQFRLEWIAKTQNCIENIRKLQRALEIEMERSQRLVAAMTISVEAEIDWLTRQEDSK